MGEHEDGRTGAGEQGLTRDEVAEVLRRAAELDSAADEPRHLPELTPPSVVEAAAVEAGLSADAVRRALNEMAVRAPHAADRTGATEMERGRVTLVRPIAGSRAAVEARLEEFLRRQLFVRERIYDHGSLWFPARGTDARVRREVGGRARLVLRSVDAVEVRVVEDRTSDGEHVIVRFDLDVAGLARRRRRQLGRTTTIGVAAGGGAGLAFGPEALLVAGPVSAAWATRGQLRGRRKEQQVLARIDVALHGLLDRIEHGVPEERMLPGSPHTRRRSSHRSKPPGAGGRSAGTEPTGGDD